jgi:hypothetical protein
MPAIVGGWNPFQNEPLRLPEYYEWLKALTKAAGGDSERGRQSNDKRAPFNRLVDGWLVAIALGARFRDEGDSFEPASHRFEYGARLAGDEHAINFLHHVALAELLRSAKTPEEREEAAYRVIEAPSQVIAICNDLAARGMPHLREIIDGATLPPLPELLRGLGGLLEEADLDSELAT